GNVVPSCTVVARTRALKSVGGFDMAPELRSAEDYELWMRLAHEFPAHAVNQTMARYRVAVDNVSQNLASKFEPEKNALVSVQRKFGLPETLMRRAFAGLHMRHFRYTVDTEPAKAMEHLNTSWTLNPLSFRTFLYKAATTLGGAAAGRLL